MASDLRDQIEKFYLPRQLVDAIHEVGGIPRESEEAEIGVAFMDIANYTFLSKFLTPKENHQVLNGLYTAFNSVLQRRGGYLNKIEGDSIMFHYGGLIDKRARSMHERRELQHYIARELFYTCIEMQRVSVLFNNADSKFVEEARTESDRAALKQAYAIIDRLRNDDSIANPLSAMFQIRIRIGANLGEVTIGNFGPEGARQWDVIGMPVIDAKRMESTAPIGGLRISSAYYQILEEIGIVEEYFQRFRREARALGSSYAAISKDELFLRRRVILREKANAHYETYSIQVNPSLPEQISIQARALIEHGSRGANQVSEMVRYYRGNRYVIDALERSFAQLGMRMHVSDIYSLMYPQRYQKRLVEHDGDEARLEDELRNELSLYEILYRLGTYQDIVGNSNVEHVGTEHFSNYPHYVSTLRDRYQDRFERLKAEIAQREYFDNVVFPMVFIVVEAMVLEYQANSEDLELLGS